MFEVGPYIVTIYYVQFTGMWYSDVTLMSHYFPIQIPSSTLLWSIKLLLLLVSNQLGPQSKQLLLIVPPVSFAFGYDGWSPSSSVSVLSSSSSSCVSVLSSSSSSNLPVCFPFFVAIFFCIPFTTGFRSPLSSAAALVAYCLPLTTCVFCFCFGSGGGAWLSSFFALVDALNWPWATFVHWRLLGWSAISSSLLLLLWATFLCHHNLA